MNAIYDALARLIVGLIFGPLDRAICRWSHDTHTP